MSCCVGECGHPRRLVDYHVGPCYCEAEAVLSRPGSEGPTAGAVEQPDRAQGEHPLPAAGVHLLAADEVVGQGYGTSSQVTLCGELVGASELPPSLCPSPDQDEHLYCPACVREAIRWKADSAAHIVAQLKQLRELVTRDG